MANFEGEIILSKTDPDKDKLVLTGDPKTLIFLVSLIEKSAILKPNITSNKDYAKFIKSNNLKKVELDISSSGVSKSMLLSILSFSKGV